MCGHGGRGKLLENPFCMLISCFEPRSTNDKILKLERFINIFYIFKHNPKKHWSDSSGWEMVMILCDIVINRLREVLGVVKFISLSTNEDTAINNSSWVGSMHMCLRNRNKSPFYSPLKR